MASTQLNVRIDADLKRAGDAVLERSNVSAVQVVRAAWQYMADHQRLPDFMNSEDTGAKNAKPVPGDCLTGMAIRFAREAGLHAELDSMSFDELRESAYEEMLAEEAERHA